MPNLFKRETSLIAGCRYSAPEADRHPQIRGAKGVQAEFPLQVKLFLSEPIFERGDLAVCQGVFDRNGAIWPDAWLRKAISSGENEPSVKREIPKTPQSSSVVDQRNESMTLSPPSVVASSRIRARRVRRESVLSNSARLVRQLPTG